MIFDSEEQRKRVIDLIGEAPVHTNIKGILSGPTPELVDLMDRLIRAPIMEPGDQTVALLELAARKKREAGE